MQTFFRRLWQWVQKWLAPLLGSPRSPLGAKGEVGPLTDTDYEFLFNQLLEGIAHGWHEGRILKFFNQLEDRCRPRDWVGWLDRFEGVVLASASPNLVLAARMMRLGELAQSFPTIAPIGDRAYHIGRELYARQAPPQEDTVWEYEGPDALVPGLDGVSDGTDSRETASPPEGSYTLEDLEDRLRQDAEFAAHFAQNLGLDTTDADVILQTLMDQFNQAQQALENLPPPETVQEWFEQGIRQAQIGELEAAIASWEQAITLEPTFAPAWHNRGSALGNLGRLEEALLNFQQAALHNPEDPYIWFNQAMVLEALNRHALALPNYEKALAIDPNLAEARQRLEHLQTFKT